MEINSGKPQGGRISYWKYTLKGNGVKFAAVVLVVFGLFYLAGLWMPEINNLMELKYLAIIIGVPAALFFIGNYLAWRKL